MLAALLLRPTGMGAFHMNALKDALPENRKCIAVDETKLKAVGRDTRSLASLDAELKEVLR